MERADDLDQFGRECFAIFESAHARAFADTFSRAPGTIVVGTAAEEWWSEYDVVATALRVQLDELPPFRVVLDEVVSWREETGGWTAARGSIEVVDGQSTAVRATIVSHREGPYWRIVRSHMSGPTTSEETLGRTLTTAFDELIALVENEPAPSGIAGPDGAVTVAFTDIESSTALMESLGEESWRALQAWHDEVITQQTRAFGGAVIKGVGDDFMPARSPWASRRRRRSRVSRGASRSFRS